VRVACDVIHCAACNASTNLATHSSTMATARVQPADVRDLDWKARNHKALRWQHLEIVQLLDMAVTDVAPSLVSLPDQAGIAGLREFLRGVKKRRVRIPGLTCRRAN
jgi:hypothetical protein